MKRMISLLQSDHVPLNHDSSQVVIQLFYGHGKLSFSLSLSSFLSPFAVVCDANAQQFCNHTQFRPNEFRYLFIFCVQSSFVAAVVWILLLNIHFSHDLMFSCGEWIDRYIFTHFIQWSTDQWNKKKKKRIRMKCVWWSRFIQWFNFSIALCAHCSLRHTNHRPNRTSRKKQPKNTSIVFDLSIKRYIYMATSNFSIIFNQQFCKYFASPNSWVQNEKSIYSSTGTSKCFGFGRLVKMLTSTKQCMRSVWVRLSVFVCPFFLFILILFEYLHWKLLCHEPLFSN